jgi:hypothetical protein
MLQNKNGGLRSVDVFSNRRYLIMLLGFVPQPNLQAGSLVRWSFFVSLSYWFLVELLT